MDCCYDALSTANQSPNEIKLSTLKRIHTVPPVPGMYLHTYLYVCHPLPTWLIILLFFQKKNKKLFSSIFLSFHISGNKKNTLRETYDEMSLTSVDSNIQLQMRSCKNIRQKETLQDRHRFHLVGLLLRPQ